MNEMYVITVLMLYTLLLLFEALFEAYPLLAPTAKEVRNDPEQLVANLVHAYVAPLILKVNSKKDYRLNMKRRPPILSMAHLG